MSTRARKIKDHGAFKKMMEKWYENINIVNDHLMNDDNNKALLAIAIFESVYESKRLFNKSVFDLLNLLDSGGINQIINEAANEKTSCQNLGNILNDKLIDESIQIIALLIQIELPTNKGLARQCTGVKYSDDVVVLEFGIHKVTLLKYEDKFRLLHIYNKDKKRTTCFKNYFFDTSEEIFTYMNNIDEYSEFTTDVLEMIKF
jgi:hypothetical protein